MKVYVSAILYKEIIQLDNTIICTILPGQSSHLGKYGAEHSYIHRVAQEEKEGDDVVYYLVDVVRELNEAEKRDANKRFRCNLHRHCLLMHHHMKIGIKRHLLRRMIQSTSQTIRTNPTVLFALGVLAKLHKI